jgi:PDZ domain-containing protein
LVALACVLALSVVPTPYYAISPGNAVDLTSRVAVEGRSPPRRRFFLTDVAVTRIPALLLAARFLPGIRIVRRDEIVPAGETPRSYDRLLYDAMGNSQNVAAFVAERAAGFAIPEPLEDVIVAALQPGSPATGRLRAGDRLRSVAGTAIGSAADVSRAVDSAPRGRPLAIGIERDGLMRTVAVRPLATAAGPRLGVLVRGRLERPQLPVPVRFSLDGITGSSGGLMFALAIYAQLRAGGAGPAVAGTGTLDRDGRVGPIEGTLQKFIAARRAGAALFLVPRQNYAEIAGQVGPRIVPVSSFSEARRALGE